MDYKRTSPPPSFHSVKLFYNTPWWFLYMQGGSEEYAEALRLNESLNNEITGLKNLIQTHPIHAVPG